MAKTCSKCKATLPVDAKFCSHCGTNLEVKTQTCSNCKQENNAEASFCIKCGHDLNKKSSKRRSTPATEAKTSAPVFSNKQILPLAVMGLLAVVITAAFYYTNFWEPLQSKQVQQANPHNHPTEEPAAQQSTEHSEDDGHFHPPSDAELAAVAEQLKSNPDDLTLNVQMGNMLFDSGKYEDAIPYYRKSLSIDPNNPDVIVDLGVCFFNMEQYEKAKEQFELAHNLDSNHVNALYNLGVVAVQNGEVNQLVQYWSKLQEVAPNSPQAQRAMQVLNQIHQEVNEFESGDANKSE